MLIGKGSRRPNREKIRNIKEALGTALNLPEETAVTVTELTESQSLLMPFLNYTGAPMTGLLRPWMLKAISPSGEPNAPQFRFCPMTDFPLRSPFHHFLVLN